MVHCKDSKAIRGRRQPFYRMINVELRLVGLPAGVRPRQAPPLRTHTSFYEMSFQKTDSFASAAATDPAFSPATRMSVS